MCVKCDVHAAMNVGDWKEVGRLAREAAKANDDEPTSAAELPADATMEQALAVAPEQPADDESDSKSSKSSKSSSKKD